MRAVLLLAGLAMPLAAQGRDLARVGWLAGCWVLESPQRIVEENWTAARGRSMVGVSRTIRGDSMTTYELVILRERKDASLAYEAHPAGQPTATFTAIHVSDSAVVFENRAHDFPQRVGYRRVGADSLLGSVEGVIGGQLRRQNFPYARTRCAGPSSTRVPATESPRRRASGPLTPAERDSLVREVAARRAAWRARGIRDYRIRVQVECFCPWPGNAAVLEVRGGVARALSDTTGRSMGRPREPWSLYTVEGLFDELERHAQRSDVIEVVWDAQYGYPASMRGDAKVGQVDDWFAVTASRLTPLR